MATPRGRRRAIRTAVLAAAVAAATVTADRSAEPAAPAPPLVSMDPVEGGLRALHQGDYSRAFEQFRRAADAAPGDPAPLFYLLFSRWWQMLFAGGAPARGDASWSAFEHAYDDAISAANARLASAPDDARALAAIGGAQVLRAHVEAQLGGYFRAGTEARRGRKALHRALEIDPSLETALFPMGALNYYADRVPLVVKTFRPLFFLPGGDAPEGLGQIRRVAEGSGRLRTDGRLLLGLICSDRYQRAYKEGLAHLEIARRESGGSPLVGAAIGDLQERLGEPDQAATTFSQAIEQAAGPGPERARQRRWLRLGRAEALVTAWRLAEGEAELSAAAGEPATSSPALARLEGRVREELQAKQAAVPALSDGPPAARLEAAQAAVNAHPEAPISRLLRGRLLFLAGRDQDAAADLAAAAPAAADGPVWLLGWIELYSGFVEARLGHPSESRAHFQAAAGLRRFRSSDRAALELGERGRDAGLCAP